MVRNIEAALDPGADRATERLKLIATDKPTSFEALLLGSLDQARASRGARGIENPLEQVLDAIGAGKTTRALVRAAATGDWTTAELTLETTR